MTEYDQIQEAAVQIQQTIEEMSLVTVFGGCAESLAQLGDYTLRDLLLMWLDNLHDDQHAGGDHEREIGETEELLEAMKPAEEAASTA